MAPTTAKKRKPQARAEDSAAFGPIAERFRRAGDLDRAVSLCREGLQKFPDHISARVTLGWALLDLGNFNEARIELELVLRRAPDNLSAIRGLAELHDRSEHTMDLPMDGPGQWPPNPDTIEQLNSAPTAVSARSAANDDIVDEAVWAPGGDVGASPDDLGAIAPAEDGGAMWSAATTVEAEIGSLLTPATGMSSVREIDPGADGVSLSAFEEPASSESVLIAGDAIAALDVDLQALIAEADTLEAAADVASLESVESAEPTLVLDAAVDLSAFEDATAELTAGFDAVADPEPVAAFTELDSLVASADQAELNPPVELIASAEPEALIAFVAPEALTATAEPTALAAPIEVEPEIVVEPELVAPPVEVEELTAVVDDTPSFHLTPWDEAMAVHTDDAGVDELSAESPFDGLTLMFDFETVPEPVAIEEIDEEEVEREEQAEIETAEVVSFVPMAAAAQVRSPLPALERFLGQVQHRRRLMAESVA